LHKCNWYRFTPTKWYWIVGPTSGGESIDINPDDPQYSGRDKGDISSMAILVTGGAGYIGSHTAKALSRAGLEPVVVDSLERGYREAVRWGPLVEANVGDRRALQNIFHRYAIDAVFHFAAFISVGESMQTPALYFQNNVVNTLSLLEAMRENEIRKIVFSSTAAVYGLPKRVPIAEDHPQHPVNPYGESKLMVERLLEWYGRIHGLGWVSLRYFNAAGADLDGELGENHDPETHLIPLALLAALGKIPHLEIFGSDYETADGTAVRDYLHVADLAEAHLSALRYLNSGGASAAFNLGTGQGHSVREVVAAVGRVSGQDVKVRETARRAGDSAALVADPTRAAKVLDWQAKHSTLDEIVRTAWNRMQKSC
jgi:UDP-glucose-4-epimerase GalE